MNIPNMEVFSSSGWIISYQRQQKIFSLMDDSSTVVVEEVKEGKIFIKKSDTADHHYFEKDDETSKLFFFGEKKYFLEWREGQESFERGRKWRETLKNKFMSYERRLKMMFKSEDFIGIWQVYTELSKKQKNWKIINIMKTKINWCVKVIFDVLKWYVKKLIEKDECLKNY